MSHLHRLLCAAAASLAILITASTSIAQEASGTPASPGAPSAPAAAADITVGGVEYAFTGLPTSVPAGTTFAFDNLGAELHQLLVVQMNEGFTETWDELMALPEQEANSKVTFIGILIAGPGKASPDTFTIDAAGNTSRSASSRRARRTA